MNFNPLTDEQLDSQNVKLIPGNSDFEVIAAKHKQSKSGNPMIELKIKLYDSQGTSGICNDYLIGIDSCTWKISSFSKSCGIYEEYKKGNLDPETLKGMGGKCVTILESYKGTNKDGNEIEGTSIKIKQYLACEQKQNTEKKKEEDDNFDDDLPF